MKPTDRRTFLQSAAYGAVGLGLAKTARAAASNRPVVGVIGTGGMGSNHVRLLAQRGDVEIAWLCDVDQSRLDEAVQTVVEAGKPAPRTAADLRHVLDDAQVDAVWIATPDHWHAPAALLALDAGKHVYVEKPCCHNIREGRLLVEAVQRTGRTLQVGTQSRSSPTVREAIDRVLAGEIGEVLVAKAWNSQLRGSIGRRQPTAPPPGLDFDLWTGPAPSVAYRENLLPSVWRWWYDFGCGDMGNDGVHDIDVALWGFGVTGHPSRVACAGGKCFFDDDQQFPDTQYAVFEYPATDAGGRPKQFIFEQRIWSPYVQEGYENGAALYGTNGMLVIGHSKGWRLYGPRNRLLAERDGGAEVPPHHQNFLDAIRGLQPLNAPIDVGHRAATLVHLANISARVGRSLEFNPRTEQIAGDAETARMVRREYRAGHWAAPRDV